MFWIVDDKANRIVPISELELRWNSPFEPKIMMAEVYEPWQPYIPSPKMHIKRVIFNGPATIVFWEDGTKTVVKCQGNDKYSKETGLALCIVKKISGNKGNYNNIFRKWVEE